MLSMAPGQRFGTKLKTDCIPPKDSFTHLVNHRRMEPPCGFRNHGFRRDAASINTAIEIRRTQGASMVKIGRPGPSKLQFIIVGLSWALEHSFNRRDACFT